MSNFLDFDLFGTNNPFPVQQQVNPNQHIVNVVFSSNGLDAAVAVQPNATIADAISQAQTQLGLAVTTNLSVSTDLNPAQQPLSDVGKLPIVNGNSVVTNIRVTAGKLSSNV